MDELPKPYDPDGLRKTVTALWGTATMPLWVLPMGVLIGLDSNSDIKNVKEGLHLMWDFSGFSIPDIYHVLRGDMEEEAIYQKYPHMMKYDTDFASNYMF